MNIKVKKETPANIKELVFNLLDILKAIGIPVNNTDRKLERMAKACLAVGKVTFSFNDVLSSKGCFLRTRDIIAFENANYGENISPGSYDDIRRQDLKLPVEAGIVVSSATANEQATNNPSRGYGLSIPFIILLCQYGTAEWETALAEFSESNKALKEELERKRNLIKVPVRLPDGRNFDLSCGKHNELQKAIIEKFLPIFGLGAEVLYMGDANNRHLLLSEEKLKDIKFFSLDHEELPDIVAYSESKNLLFLIEAFHSTGEWDEVRVRRIKRKLEESGCSANVVFFTAFENKNAFKQKAKDIAWETEVWIADNPEHLIHFNGYKFLEIHK